MKTLIELFRAEDQLASYYEIIVVENKLFTEVHLDAIHGYIGCYQCI